MSEKSLTDNLTLLDDVDRQILTLLQADSSRSTAELAEAVGLSPSPCWRRVKRLKDEGVIVGEVAIVDPRRVGKKLTAYAMVSLNRHEDDAIRTFEDALRAAPEVMDCAAVTGDRDFILRVVVEDMEAYQTFLAKRLLHLDMIRSINTSFSLRKVKSSTAVPL